MASTDGQDIDRHYRLVIKAMREGRVVPFLGAGVNLCGRPQDFVWKAGESTRLPSGHELADFLSQEWYIEGLEGAGSLLRVSHYAEVLAGPDWLYDKLHAIFSGRYGPTRVHDFLARVPERLFREQGIEPPRYQLIVTTNYDDALEQAFAAAREPYHLVWYVAEGEEHERGKFMHKAPEAQPVLIADPSEYVDVSTASGTVVLKIHGAVQRAAPDSETDSYVITEDDYIEFLTGGTAIASLIPVELANQLKRSHFLFLGYGLADWNLRVILNRIWREQRNPNNSWAIQLDPPNELDERFWLKKNIEIFGIDLTEYIGGLEQNL